MSTFTANTLDDVSMPMAASVQPAKVGMSIRKLLAVGVMIALFAGGIGALISAVAFPAHSGKAGVRGPAGPAGPVGSAASVANVNVDTNKLGYCFNTNGGTDSMGDYSITSVSLSAPTDTGGNLSCAVGQFVSLTPTSPQTGLPVASYNAMASTSGASTSAPTSSASSSAPGA